MADKPNQDQEIDERVNALFGTLDVAGTMFPQFHLAVPLIEWFIKHKVVDELKTGLKQGTVVPDGQGGYVPANNSLIDPETGMFLSDDMRRKAEEGARVDHGGL